MLLKYVTVLAKPVLFALKLNSILLLQFTDTLNIVPSPVYQVLNVNWSAFLEGILPALQGHGWNNGTHGGCQLDSGTWICSHWLCGPLVVSLATVWASCLLMKCPKGVGIMAAHGVSQGVVFATSHPTRPSPSLPTTHPTHPIYYQY